MIDSTQIATGISPTFAAQLRLPKAEIVTLAGTTATVRQLGGAYLPDPIRTPWSWPDGLSATEPMYEMFTLDDAQGVAAMGACDEVDAWHPLVERVANMLFGALAAADVPVAGSVSLTASLTPMAEVSGGAHFDDNQFVADQDLGFFAIIGSHCGPQVSLGSITVTNVLAPPSELNLLSPLGDPEVDFDWASASKADPDHCVLVADADKLILLPQFGQLHSGPRLGSQGSAADPLDCRQLFVIRGRTLVDANALG